MQCINCKSIDVAVIDTRRDGCIRRRKYKCSNCGARFKTLEGYETDALFRDGSWLSVEHLELVAKQLEEGSAELAALAKRFRRKRSDNGR